MALIPGHLPATALTEVLGVDVRRGSTARAVKRLAIRLAKKGIDVWSVNKFSGYRTEELADKMRNPKTSHKYGVPPANAVLIAPGTGSPHCAGEAIDLKIRSKPKGMTEDEAWDAIQEAAAKVGLYNLLYPRFTGERNHFVFTGRIDLGPLSVKAKRRYHEYALAA